MTNQKPKLTSAKHFLKILQTYEMYNQLAKHERSKKQ